MTKPHTTLSEAVRALIKNSPPHIVGHSSAKLGYSAAIDDVLKLVEQHEAQEHEAHCNLRFPATLNSAEDHCDCEVAQPTLVATQAEDAKDAARYPRSQQDYSI